MSQYSSQSSPCPKCQSPLTRIRRTSLDRKLSYVVPVSRYICFNYNCRWTGLRMNWSVHPFLGKYFGDTQHSGQSQPMASSLKKHQPQESDFSFSARSSTKEPENKSLVSASQTSSKPSAKSER